MNRTTKTLVRAGVLTGAGLVTMASSCVTVSPPAPPVTLLDSCAVSGTLFSYYSFHIGGDATTRGWFWLHTATGDTAAEFHQWGDIFQGYAVGPGWLHFATDLDDDNRYGVSAPGGAFNPPTKVCV